MPSRPRRTFAQGAIRPISCFGPFPSALWVLDVCRSSRCCSTGHLRRNENGCWGSGGSSPGHAECGSPSSRQMRDLVDRHARRGPGCIASVRPVLRTAEGSERSAFRSSESRRAASRYDDITGDPSLPLGMTTTAAPDDNAGRPATSTSDQLPAVVENQFSRTPRASELLNDRSSRLFARPSDSGKMICTSVSIPNSFPPR